MAKKNPSMAAGLSRKVLADAIRAVKDEEHLQEIEKLGLSTSETIWVTETDLPRILDWSTDKSRSARRLRFPGGMSKGTGFQINRGDRIPKGQNFRRATAEEIAAGIVTVEDAAEYVEKAQRPLRSAEALVASIKHEVERARLEVEAANRRLVDLDSAAALAEGRAEEARVGFERFFEGKPAGFRAAVETLAQRLEAPPAPAPAEELPRTLEQIERRARGDATPRAFASTASGVKALPIGRGGL